MNEIEMILGEDIRSVVYKQKKIKLIGKIQFVYVCLFHSLNAYLVTFWAKEELGPNSCFLQNPIQR